MRDQTTQHATNYRALPPVSESEFVEFLKGQTSHIVDGETRQFWDWTNRDVASVLQTIFGPDFNYVVRGKRGAGIELDPNGRVLCAEFYSSGSDGFSGYHSGTAHFELAGPTERFNRFPSWYIGRNQLPEREPDFINLEEFPRLQKQFAINAQLCKTERAVAKAADQKKRQARARHRTSKIIAAIVWSAIIALVVWGIISLIG